MSSHPVRDIYQAVRTLGRLPQRRNNPQSEAEGYALGILIREIIWVNTLLNDLKVSVLPIHVFDDSQNVLAWIRDKAIRARTRHIGVQLNFVREAEQDGTIVLDWVPGTEQID